MKCRVCGQDKFSVCCCGYCTDCIKKFTHEGCRQLIEENKNDITRR